MKKEETQETPSTTIQAIPMKVEEDWKFIREQKHREIILKFREELKELQNKYKVELIPRITIIGSEIVSAVSFNVLD